MTDAAAPRTTGAIVLAALVSWASFSAQAAPPPVAAPVAYDNANPILLKGKVVDVKVIPAGITMTVAATSLSVDGHAQPETRTWIVNGGGSMASPEDILSSLSGRELVFWGYQSADKACSSVCRMHAADVVILRPSQLGRSSVAFESFEPNPVWPFPQGGYAFAAKFDAEAPVLIKGVIEKAVFSLPYTQVWVRGTAAPARGAAPDGQEKLWLADGPRPAAVSDDTHLKLTPGAKVTIRGYLAKDKTCDPVCRVNARDIAFN